MTCLFSTAYWPNLHYFRYLLQAEDIRIEGAENYQKQSYRNRTRILSANGPLDLQIPILKKLPKERTDQVCISYQEAWQIRHWRAITSAYRNSPYFEHFEPEIEIFYTTRFDSLLEFNTLQLQAIFRILRLNKPLSLTQVYEKAPEGLNDLRALIHPKKDPRQDPNMSPGLSLPYYQTFDTKFGFIPNLSILDLLFNTGLGATRYLDEGTI
jgi:hypothetical protein